jgi:hypothetical protein
VSSPFLKLVLGLGNYHKMNKHNRLHTYIYGHLRPQGQICDVIIPPLYIIKQYGWPCLHNSSFFCASVWCRRLSQSILDDSDCLDQVWKAKVPAKRHTNNKILKLPMVVTYKIKKWGTNW